VGKEISFSSIHSLPTTDGTPRDIGNASLGDVDLGNEMLRAGWAKVKENKREDTEVDITHKELESQARSAGRGMRGCPTTLFPNSQ
jgi:staphylococcal nuclease domain-containing protein 1